MLSKNKSKKIAIIDIGSNSVRMVVYDALKRMPAPIFNEKILCGLAAGMGKTNHLNPEGVAMAKSVIARFALLSKAMNCCRFITIATSAVRDAEDGANFKKEIEQENKIKIQVISGEDEAKYATLGVISSIYKAHGIVGDLGGGSLELSCIKNGRADNHYQSFPIGPLRLKTSHNFEDATKIIDDYLNNYEQFKTYNGTNFYAVGGGFRALAKIHMANVNYPIKVLQNYSIEKTEFQNTILEIIKKPARSLKNIHLISSSRKNTLVLTALLAERILQKFNPKNIVFSVHGIREGYLYSLLDHEKAEEDPLTASCYDMMDYIMHGGLAEHKTLSHELFEWMSPLFKKESQEMTRLRMAACILSQIAWHEHTEYRAEMAFKMVMESEIAGLHHKERGFLALCLYHRYKTSLDKYTAATIKALTTRELRFQASKIGLMLRFGIALCGGATGILPNFTLRKYNDKLILYCNSSNKNLIGEPVQKRHKKLAKLIGLKPAMVVK